jgi:hydrogenase maturation protease
LYDGQIKTGPGVVADTEQNRIEGGPILVLGLGNILLKDEGIGVHVVTELQKLELGGKVEVVDGGTAGVDVLLMQEGGYKLVVVDAATGGQKPGTIYKTRLKGDEIGRQAEVLGQKQQTKVSLHQMGLIEALVVAEKTGCGPEEVVIIGVEPSEMDSGLEPTGEVQRRMPEIINTVLEEIKDAVHER